MLPRRLLLSRGVVRWPIPERLLARDSVPVLAERRVFGRKILRVISLDPLRRLQRLGPDAFEVKVNGSRGSRGCFAEGLGNKPGRSFTESTTALNLVVEANGFECSISFGRRYGLAGGWTCARLKPILETALRKRLEVQPLN
ncbi:MAG: hypothetical protein Ct9H300mP11_25280 [Chloroflexota bacterium]|nr:MAG: hypothetical protein Ct9H300mP11_25280 [Chloroflexota bacterium]